MIIKLKIGSASISVDKLKKQIDVSPFIKNDRTFVPVRFIAEAFGYNVDWNEKTEEVTITDDYASKYFETEDACAIDWAMRFNNLSIGFHKELGSSIYLTDKGYYYTFPNIGTSNNVVPSTQGSKNRVAIIHSHASTGNGTQKANKLSSSDINAANTWKCDNYAATPCGYMEVYRYATKKCEPVSYKIPYDRRALKKLKNNWGYKNIEENDKFFKEYGITKVSVEADFYNKLFLDGIVFPLFDH